MRFFNCFTIPLVFEIYRTLFCWIKKIPTFGSKYIFQLHKLTSKPSSDSRFRSYCEKVYPVLVSTQGVQVQAFGKHFGKLVEKHFLKKWSPNIVDKNVATVLQKHLSLDSIIYLNHFKLIKNYFN